MPVAKFNLEILTVFLFSILSFCSRSLSDITGFLSCSYFFYKTHLFIFNIYRHFHEKVGYATTTLTNMCFWNKSWRHAIVGWLFSKPAHLHDTKFDSNGFCETPDRGSVLTVKAFKQMLNNGQIYCHHISGYFLISKILHMLCQQAIILMSHAPPTQTAQYLS